MQTDEPLADLLSTTELQGYLTNYSRALLSNHNVAILSAHDALLATEALDFF
jgi:hypothetical protein